VSIALAFLAIWLQAGSDLEKGLSAFQRGDLEGALAALTQAVRKNPTAQAWKALGVVFASKEEYDRAEPALAQACRLDSGEPQACYYWARALYALNRFSDSLAALDKAPSIQPAPWRVVLARAEALSGLGRAGEAQKFYLEAIRARKEDRSPPQSIDPTLSYARHLYREGRTDEVLEILTSAGAAYQQVPEWHYQVGRALLQLDRADEAIGELKRAVALQPGYKEAHNVLSKAYYRSGNAVLGAEHARLSGQGSSTSR